jgi:hypothetical protein
MRSAPPSLRSSRSRGRVRRETLTFLNGGEVHPRPSRHALPLPLAMNWEGAAGAACPVLRRTAGTGPNHDRVVRRPEQIEGQLGQLNKNCSENESLSARGPMNPRFPANFAHSPFRREQSGIRHFNEARPHRLLLTTSGAQFRPVLSTPSAPISISSKRSCLSKAKVHTLQTFEPQLET